MKKVLITGVNSGIGSALFKELYKRDNIEIIGTYRNKETLPEYSLSCRCQFYKVDFSSSDQIERWLAQTNFSRFDTIFFIHGTLEPIGRLADIDYSLWHHSFQINYLSIVNVLNRTLKRLKIGCKIITLAGGGVNNAPDCFNAYISAKIALIKMTELLAAEYPRQLFFNLGPGWVDTPIHKQTLVAGEKAPKAFEETKRRYKNKEFVSMQFVTNALLFLMDKADNSFSGRNFSVASGELKDLNLSNILKNDPEKFKLRRHH